MREECRLRVFGSGVLRRIFESRGDEVRRKWRKLPNEELSDLYFSPKIARVIKSRTVRWTGSVARWGLGRAYSVFRWGNLREREHLGDPGVGGRKY